MDQDAPYGAVGDPGVAAAQQRASWRQHRGFILLMLWHACLITTGLSVVLSTDVIGSRRGQSAFFASFAFFEGCSLSLTIYVYRRWGWQMNASARRAQETCSDDSIFAILMLSVAPITGTVLYTLPVYLYESGTANSVDPIEAYYVSVFFGVTVVAMCIGFGQAMFHLDGAEENAWHAARVRAERLGVFPRALPRYQHRFDGSPWWLLRMLLAAASLALAQSLIPCWVRLHSGSPCGGNTPGSRFVVGWNAIVSAMIAMLFGIVGTLGFESLEEFRLISEHFLLAVDGVREGASVRLLHFQSSLVHFHAMMHARMSTMAVPLLWALLCALVSTVLLLLCYVVPAFSPFLHAHWAALLSVAVVVLALDAALFFFLARAARVESVLTQVVARLDLTVAEQARLPALAAAAAGGGGAGDAKASASASGRGSSGDTGDGDDADEEKGQGPANAERPLLPALSRRDGRDLAVLALVLSHWRSRPKGLTLAGVHLRMGLFRSFGVALGLQLLAFVAKLLENYGH